MGDVLWLVATLIEQNGEYEHAIKCVKVVYGVDTCTVAFAPCNHMSLDEVKAHTNKFVQASKIYAGSNNTHKRSKAAANFGVALVKLPSKEEGRDEQKVIIKGHSFQLLWHFNVIHTSLDASVA